MTSEDVGKLLERYRSDLFSFALSRNYSHQDVEDAFGEISFKLLKYKDNININPEKEKNYLFGVMSNQLVDMRRAMFRRPSYNNLYEFIDFVDPDDEFERIDFILSAKEALSNAQLTTKQRRAMKAYYIDGNKNPSIKAIAYRTRQILIPKMKNLV